MPGISLLAAEVIVMKKVVLDVPTLWADHHVLKVRDVLSGLAGVDGVYASSAWKQVLVNYDEEKIDQVAIERALADAGYPVGEGVLPVLAETTSNRKDPRWKEARLRMTQTNQVDLEMSGEFRRY
jgi:copper chaperone CopZ